MWKKLDVVLAIVLILFSAIALIALPLLNWGGSEVYGSMVDFIVRKPMEFADAVFVQWSWPKSQLAHLDKNPTTGHPVPWLGYLWAAFWWMVLAYVAYFVISGILRLVLGDGEGAGGGAGAGAGAGATGGGGGGAAAGAMPAKNIWNFLIAAIIAAVFVGMAAYADNFWDQYQDRRGEQSQINDAITAMNVTCGADSFNLLDTGLASNCLGIWKKWRDVPEVEVIANQLEARLSGSCTVLWNKGNSDQQEMATRMAKEGVTGCPVELMASVDAVPWNQQVVAPEATSSGMIPDSRWQQVLYTLVILGLAAGFTVVVRVGGMGQPIKPITGVVVLIFVFSLFTMWAFVSIAIQHVRLA
jgi:hypothetical protein